MTPQQPPPRVVSLGSRRRGGVVFDDEFLDVRQLSVQILEATPHVDVFGIATKLLVLVDHFLLQHLRKERKRVSRTALNRESAPTSHVTKLRKIRDVLRL